MPELKLIILDVDGTVRHTLVPNQPCPNAPGEWELLPGVRERLESFSRPGAPQIAFCSNQGGVGLKYLSAELALQMLVDTYAAATGVVLVGNAVAWRYIAVCFHVPNLGCACRKPAPGMLVRLMDTWGVYPHEVLMVGDLESDREAATRAGCLFEYAEDFFGWGK